MSVQQRSNSSLTWIYSLLLILSLFFIGWGVYLFAKRPEQPMVLAVGLLAGIVVLLAWTLTLYLETSRKETTARQEAILHAISEQIRSLAPVLTQISEQQLISERAKAIAFRESEREALRRAIAEETSRKDWDAALVLANEMETVFGYKQEADRVREEIAIQRNTDVRRQITDALTLIDKFCRGEQWTLALREADRLIAAFPNDPQVQRIPQNIEDRRQALKQQLLDAWNDAVSRHDVDGGIEILKQLDIYLTPAEAESMQDTARRVFKDKLMLLGQQFAAAVKNHVWAEAVRLGESIIAEFPNSRMAQEVREKIDLLRQRSASPEATKV